MEGLDIRAISQLLAQPEHESDSDEDDKVCGLSF